jgi:hypothetical protein
MGWGRRATRGKRSKPTSRKGKNGLDLLKKSTVVMEPQMRKRWDSSKTVKQNYEALGLVADPNRDQAPAENPITLMVAEQKPRDEPRLFLPEIINTREMIMKHGTARLIHTSTRAKDCRKCVKCTWKSMPTETRSLRVPRQC